jgi:hypothetical protein
MARKVKCAITGEDGTNETFIKIGSKYYKSQEIYDQDRRCKDLHKKIVDIILNDFLNYQQCQIPSSLLFKKLKELEFYDNEVILKTIEQQSDTIKYWMNNKEFQNDNGKIAYLFAIIKGSINDVHKEWERNKIVQQKENQTSIDINIDIKQINTSQKGKDITAWLEDDDI